MSQHGFIFLRLTVRVKAEVDAISSIVLLSMTIMTVSWRPLLYLLDNDDNILIEIYMNIIIRVYVEHCQPVSIQPM